MGINKVDIKKGLTIDDVEDRYNKKLVNYDTSVDTKTVKEIVLENILTLFNIINLILACAVIIVGSFKNLAFMGIIIANTLISTFQQLRSKRILDKLQIVAENKVLVRREGVDNYLNINEIVMDDIIILKAGNQVVVDSILRSGNVSVDESFVTGESDTIYKKSGDHLLSGSFIVSGEAICQVEHIGVDNYTAKISSDTKYIKAVSSEIMRSLNKIVKYISMLILPVAILLFFRQLYIEGNCIENAVVNTTAALIGMIPEGLVLLTSTVLAVSVYTLSKRKVLVQDLYCIETLARVDVLCLDKTGTITVGDMEVVKEERLTKVDLGEIVSLICEETKDNNPTAIALMNKYKNKLDVVVKESFPFSSKNKYSGVLLENGTTYLMGAPEFVLKDIGDYKQKIDEYSKNYRVLAVVSRIGDKSDVLGFILLQDRIRDNASKTLKYFKEQGVNLKIISGDNPLTVRSIAERAGMTNLLEIDASLLKEESDIVDAVSKYNVFGRVTPEQKRDFVIALQNLGHTVAMTGDGVNDVLALKEADCSVAMASGSDATKNVSQLVLLDSDFSAMPDIVEEGRRTINNIERSASLFLVKTIYAAILAILFIFIEEPYPFIPIQLTLASVSTIGIPSFLLSFEPNNEMVKGSFLPNVLKRSLPAALTIVLNIMIITFFKVFFNMSYYMTSTLAVFMTGFVTFILLYKICQPFNKFRGLLVILMFTIFLLGFFLLQDIFSFVNFNLKMILIVIFNGLISYYFYSFLDKKLILMFEKIAFNREERRKKILKKQENT